MDQHQASYGYPRYLSVSVYELDMMIPVHPFQRGIIYDSMNEKSLLIVWLHQV